nr:ribonuclease H-like domain-containing protein [Tanacetum cinerariifolium]
MVQTPVRNHVQRGNHQHYARMTHPNPQRHVVPTAVLTRSKLVLLTAARPVTAAVLHNNMIRPRPAKTIGIKPHSPPRKAINLRPSPPVGNFPLKVTTVKAPKVNAVKGQSTACFEGQRSYRQLMLQELKFNLFSVSQICDKKNKVLFIDTECIVLSPEFKLPDENQVLLRVPIENNMYNVDLKNIVLSRDLTCLFAKDTDDDATFEVKEPEFEVEKPKSEVYVSSSSSAKKKKHDDKTKREAKGKSHVELSTGYRNLSEEFEDFSDNSINEVNAASTLVPAVGKILTNSTNTFSAAGPFNTVVSPTLRESSYVDHFQYPDDPNMPALEDITYFDDDEDVGAEADFTNLETTITFSPILTTRVHKDHPVTQIIEEPKRVHQAFKDPSWIEVMSEELLQFKMQKVWVLVDFPNGKRAIGHTQEEGIDYEEVFAPVARIEAISAAGPSNAAVSLTLGKSSYVDSSQLLDDPNMPKFRNIYYRIKLDLLHKDTLKRRALIMKKSLLQLQG